MTHPHPRHPLVVLPYSVLQRVSSRRVAALGALPPVDSPNQAWYGSHYVADLL